MRGSSKTATLIFGGLTVLMMVVIVGAFIGAVSWVNKPFAGFMLYDFPQVGTYSLKDWPGRQAGIKSFDHILLADGQPVKEGRELVERIENKAPGSTITYTLSAKGGAAGLFAAGDYV